MKDEKKLNKEQLEQVDGGSLVEKIDHSDFPIFPIDESDYKRELLNREESAF